MNALVLGGNGFIGSHLVDRLIAEGASVRVFDRNNELFRKPNKSVDYYYADFGNRSLLVNALKNIDIVFHLICTTIPKTSNDDPIFDVLSNVVETLYLLEKCVEMKIRKLVYLSSGGAIYGIPEKLPVPEDSSTNPACSYGITKLTIEKYLSLFHKLHGLNYTVIRPSNPYGPRQNPMGMQGAITVFLKNIVQNEAIEIWGDGSIVRDYIYIDDLIDGIYKASHIDTISRIFNIGSGQGLSLNQIIVELCRTLKRDVQVRHIKGRPFDIPEITLCIQRARQELRWQPAIALNTGVRKTWEFVNDVLSPRV